MDYPCGDPNRQRIPLETAASESRSPPLIRRSSFLSLLPATSREFGNWRAEVCQCVGMSTEKHSRLVFSPCPTHEVSADIHLPRAAILAMTSRKTARQASSSNPSLGC